MYQRQYDLTRPWKDVMEQLADDDVHSEFYSSANPLVSYLHRRRLEIIRELIRREEQKDVLEVGCGDGFVLAALAVDPTLRLTGVELSQKRIVRAIERAPTARVIQGDATQLPFDSDSFDIVVCSEVLEHIPQPKTAAAEMRRVTRPGGVIIVTVPNERNWRVGRALLLRFPVRIPDHVNSFTRRSMTELFQLNPERYSSIPPLGAQLSLTQLFSYRLPG